MDEMEWLTCSSVRSALQFLEGRVSDRRFHLFSCACWRRAWDCLPDQTQRDALEASERVVDGVGTSEDNEIISQIFGDFPGSGEMQLVGSIFHLRRSRSPTQAMWLMASSKVSPSMDENTWSETRDREHRLEENAQTLLIRDIFGNPFRPVTFDPRWRTATALAIAKDIYDDRAFDRLPILADALLDAGCDNDDILTHLRDTTTPHVRGCWALDLVLGKE